MARLRGSRCRGASLQQMCVRHCCLTTTGMSCRSVLDSSTFVDVKPSSPTYRAVTLAGVSRSTGPALSARQTSSPLVLIGSRAPGIEGSPAMLDETVGPQPPVARRRVPLGSASLRLSATILRMRSKRFSSIFSGSLRDDVGPVFLSDGSIVKLLGYGSRMRLAGNRSPGRRPGGRTGVVAD